MLSPRYTSLRRYVYCRQNDATDDKPKISKYIDDSFMTLFTTDYNINFARLRRDATPRFDRRRIDDFDDDASH
jgi:hypothetical protein